MTEISFKVFEADGLWGWTVTAQTKTRKLGAKTETPPFGGINLRFETKDEAKENAIAVAKEKGFTAVFEEEEE